MQSAPKAYKQNGLELYNFEDEKVGSIYPEYFYLYEIIDEANTKWKNWTKTARSICEIVLKYRKMTAK